MADSIPGDPDKVTEPRRVTAAEMRRRIHAQYGRTTLTVPEHLVLFEVGARQSDWKMRRIDAVAVGLVKRSGYLIHGFEIKVSRADLRQKLREPGKAAAGARFCDRWWLALSGSHLLDDRLPIPSGWGIVLASDRGLRVIKEPAAIDRVESPEFRAALLHASQRSPGYRYAMGYQRGLQQGRDEGRAKAEKRYRDGFRHGQWQERYDAEQREKSA